MWLKTGLTVDMKTRDEAKVAFVTFVIEPKVDEGEDESKLPRPASFLFSVSQVSHKHATKEVAREDGRRLMVEVMKQVEQLFNNFPQPH